MLRTLKTANSTIVMGLILASLLVFQNCSRLRSDSTSAVSVSSSMSPAEFAADRESKFYLPVAYTEVREGLETLATNFADEYLNIPLVATERTGTGSTTCGGAYVLADWNYPYNWPALAYAASAFESGSIITRGDPEKPGLSLMLRATFLQIADHMITAANATNFSGFTLPNGEKPLGWNNLASPWDAWNNGTCSPATKPNIWASALALEVLANAYMLTKDMKYMDAFNKGSSYWHSNIPASTLNTLSNVAAIQSKAASFGPLYAITSTNTVGGATGYSSVGLPPDQLFIRYHYYDDDPGSYAVNDSASMALAMIEGGIANPAANFSMNDGKGGSVPRTFANIGFYAMADVLLNVKSGNYGYYDIDDVNYPGPSFETHFLATSRDLARAGVISGNQYFLEGARAAMVNILATVPADSVNLELHGLAVCLTRELDPVISTACKNNYSAFKAEWGTHNLLGLWATTSLLGAGFTLQ